MPKYTDEMKLGNKGVRLVESAVHEHLDWIFRDKRKDDVGVDGEIEIVNVNRPTGKLIAVQIKCGASWLHETTEDGYVFRFSQDKLEYWSTYSIPVIVVLCDPDTGLCYWIEVSASTAIKAQERWKVIVPFSNVLDVSAAPRLAQLANRMAATAYLAELCVLKWLRDKFGDRVHVPNILEQPRDLHAIWGLAFTQSNETWQVDMCFAVYGRFQAKDVSRALEYRSYNERACGSGRLAVFLVATTPHAFNYDKEMRCLMATAGDVAFVRLLLVLDEEAHVSEVVPGGYIVSEYVLGEPIFCEGRLASDYRIVSIEDHSDALRAAAESSFSF